MAANSWLGGLVGQGGMSGDQIDALRTFLFSSLRVIPEKLAPRDNEGRHYTKWEKGERSASPSSASGVAAEAARTQNTLYDRLHAAMAERGEMLGDLEDTFNNLEQGSKGMVAQAKKLAAQQTAKGWFSSMGSQGGRLRWATKLRKPKERWSCIQI
ncbi:hypothetical protein C8R46DRAFT_1066564 [Mycena filopes]|nr:hypothetical protein C8R46DRAFT_1066564 [Mycena filopes]